MVRNKITPEDVKRISELSNLDLSKDELNNFADILTDTLGYIDILNELDTSTTLETSQVTGLTNVFQEDDDVPTTLSQTEAMRNANEEKQNLFVTKAVFDR